jgi:uncharacterized protein YgiM (DUF1202 family)
VALLALAVLAPWEAAGPGRAVAAPAFVRVAGSGFAIGSALLPAVHGVNYEGPLDQAWHMWNANTFSPALIAADFDRAAQAGYDPVRIFVQDPLPAQVLAGDFSRLDAVVALARERGLHLLLTFNDDHDSDLARVAHVDSLIAAHLAHEPAIFGYDLDNEPGLGQIAGALYPAGVSVPLQGAAASALLARYPVTTYLPRARTGGSGGTRTVIVAAPVRLPAPDLGSLLSRFLATNPDYPYTPAPASWQPFVDACNQSLAAYLQVQVGAIRAADPVHLITTGYNSAFWASLPANALLDFRSIHLYPWPTYGGIQASLASFARLRALSTTPLLLEEYGFPTAAQSPQATANQEMAMALSVHALGGAGDLKWMLNDVPNGATAMENTLGVFDASEQPKPIFFASQAARAYFAGGPQHESVALAPGAGAGVSFRSLASNGLAVGGTGYADSRVRYAPAGAGSGQVWLSWAVQNHLSLEATLATTISVNLPALVGAGAVAPVAVAPAGTAWWMRGRWLTMVLLPGMQVDVSAQPAPSTATPTVTPTPPPTATATPTSPPTATFIPTAPPTATMTSTARPLARRVGQAQDKAALRRFLSRYHSFVTVTIPALRVRAGPSLHARQVGVVTANTTLALLGVSGLWRHIAAFPHTSGWVYGAYVRDTSLTTLQTGTPTPSPATGTSTPPPATGTSTQTGTPTPPPATAVHAKVTGRAPAATATATRRLVDIRRLGPVSQVLRDGVRVRRGPSLTAPVMFVTYHGTLVAVRQVHASWVRVTFATGVTGWIFGQYLHMPAAPRVQPQATPSVAHPQGSTEPTAYVWAPALHVRAAPRLSGKVVRLIAENTAVRVLGTHVSWSHVRLADGTVGWVLTHYIKSHPRSVATKH